MMKTKVTDCTNMVFIESEIELSWPIGLGMVCDENQIGQ